MLGLNIGAGGNLKPTEEGWVNIDVRSLPGIDQVVNLERDNLPYAANTVDEINMQDFLEHLSVSRQKSFLDNTFMVLKPGGSIYIQIPHLKVLAERYLGVLENPTELQHPLTGKEFAQSLYGGQDYLENFHKWGYDETSLKQVLVEIGFAVRRVGSDGGQNLLCQAYKPTDTVYIAVGGGLGDVIQVYLSSPKHHDAGQAFPNDEFPSTDTYASLWFHRLQDFHERHPGIKIILLCQSHNTATRELFEEHPYIDEIIDLEWHVPKPGDELKWEKDYQGAGNIHALYDYQDYTLRDTIVYLTVEERNLVDAIQMKGNFILVHPYARGVRDKMISRSKWLDIISYLLEYRNVVVVGVGNDGAVFDCNINGKYNYVNLVNKVSVRVSIELALLCNAFVGTHSAMILPAWSKRVKSACIVPPTHDGGQSWELFFASDNPTTWGADKDFNKTITVMDKEINIQEIVGWVS